MVMSTLPNSKTLNNAVLQFGRVDITILCISAVYINWKLSIFGASQYYFYVENLRNGYFLFILTTTIQVLRMLQQNCKKNKISTKL